MRTTLGVVRRTRPTSSAPRADYYALAALGTAASAVGLYLLYSAVASDDPQPKADADGAVGPKIEEPIGDAVTVASTYPNRRVGIMVAGNSGRPGGAVAADDRTIDIQKVHERHKTQEESIVSAWMVGMCGKGNQKRMNYLYEKSIAKQWGLREFSGTDRMTIQGVDYGTTQDPKAYEKAWVVDNQTLQLAQNGRFVTETTNATLVFVAGPNAGEKGTDDGTMKRTRNALAVRDYAFFRKCVAAAVRAGLDAMIDKKIDVALVAPVSNGIYAGPHEKKIKAEFVGLVQEVCSEKRENKRRADYFSVVAIPRIAAQPQKNKNKTTYRPIKK